ncbi:MAG: methyl-accepting chemotaxis protein [Candidatus Omnitrophota bacterium]|jgi:methyl-accepting chemotaxis protein
MEDYKRRNYFIDKSFQTKFIVKFSIIVVVSSLVIGTLLFFLLKYFTIVTTENIHATAVRSTPNFILPVVMETISIVIALAGLSVIFLTVLTWHRIEGPLFRLNKELGKLKDGDLKVNFATRSNDQLKELSTSLTDMSAVLIAKHLELKKKIGELKDSLRNVSEDKEAVLKKANELEEILSYFKT